MTERGIDAVLVSCEVNQRWISGFDFTDGYILVCSERAYLITDPRYIEAAKKRPMGLLSAYAARQMFRKC